MNPNAKASGATMVAAGAVTWLAHKLGYTIESYYAILIAGAVSSAVLWVGREGLAGTWDRILHGGKKTP